MNSLYSHSPPQTSNQSLKNPTSPLAEDSIREFYKEAVKHLVRSFSALKKSAEMIQKVLLAQNITNPSQPPLSIDITPLLLPECQENAENELFLDGFVEQRLFEFLSVLSESSQAQNNVATIIALDLSVLSSQIFSLWRQMLPGAARTLTEIVELYREVWLSRQSDRYLEWIIMEESLASEFGPSRTKLVCLGLPLLSNSPPVQDLPGKFETECSEELDSTLGDFSGGDISPEEISHKPEFSEADILERTFLEGGDFVSEILEPDFLKQISQTITKNPHSQNQPSFSQNGQNSPLPNPPLENSPLQNSLFPNPCLKNPPPQNAPFKNLPLENLEQEDPDPSNELIPSEKKVEEEKSIINNVLGRWNGSRSGENLSSFKSEHTNSLQKMESTQLLRSLNKSIQQLFKDAQISGVIPPADLHVKIADMLRKARPRVYSTHMPIEDLATFSKINIQPAMFVQSEQGYELGSGDCDEDAGLHLFVLVHGFQGCSSDMRILKNNLSLLSSSSGCVFVSATSNGQCTNGNIDNMGRRLAMEVQRMIEDICKSSFCLHKLSFLGHSLGGLIVRASLQYLQKYSSKFHSFITLSSPHLGYLSSSSKIVDAGLWLLTKWKKSTSLQQLTISDSKDLKDCYLYKLSQISRLHHFKNIAFLSSHQDQYAPFESARVEIIQGPKNFSARFGDPVYMQMAHNLLDKIPPQNLYRIDVNFKLSDRNLDTFIGRAAHIQFLENQNFMKMLVQILPFFFR